MQIDRRAHIHIGDSLVGYGSEAMQEMLVIRFKDLVHAKMDNLDEFKFHGFHQLLYELGREYVRPSLNVNNAIARIINRRDCYSAHHGDGKGEAFI